MVSVDGATSASSVGDLEALIPAWLRSLRVENKSPKAIETYGEAARLFHRFLVEQGMPTEAARLTREHVETFIATLLERYKPATASNRYRALGRLFAFLVGEGELAASPMARMKPPTIPEDQVPVVSDDDLCRLLAVANGTDFEDGRDTAMIRLLIDTGMRAAELVNLKVKDLDLDLGVAIVLGKGRRPRSCPFGDKTAQAIDRYLRARGRHRLALREALWLGRAGPMSYPGCANCSTGGCGKPGLGTSTPTNCATASPTPSWPRAAPKVTSCSLPAGAPGRCSAATQPAPPPSGLAPPTGAWVSATGCKRGVRRR